MAIKSSWDFLENSAKKDASSSVELAKFGFFKHTNDQVHPKVRDCQFIPSDPNPSAGGPESISFGCFRKEHPQRVPRKPCGQFVGSNF